MWTDLNLHRCQLRQFLNFFIDVHFPSNCPEDFIVVTSDGYRKSKNMEPFEPHHSPQTSRARPRRTEVVRVTLPLNVYTFADLKRPL